MNLDLISKIAPAQDEIIDESIGNLFEGSFKYLYGYIFSMCMNVALADQVLSQVLTKATNEMYRFNHSTTVFIWLCELAKKELHKRKFTLPEDSEYLLYNLKVGNGDQSRLPGALKNLNTTYKDVFYMYTLGNLPYEIIGEIYGRPTAWVESTCLNAKNRILNYMGA